MRTLLELHLESENARLEKDNAALLAALTSSEQYLSILVLALREGAVRGLAKSWPADLCNVLDDIRTAIRQAKGETT